MSASAPEMSSTLEHFSHPEHPLVLKEYDVIGNDAMCYICDKTVISSPTYTCSSSDEDVECKGFYLHKSCAELPTQIEFFKHKKHPLDLLPAPSPSWTCDVCYRFLKFAYICSVDCDFAVCVLCAFKQRALCHPGHEEHTLTLVERESLFTCDACYEEAKDSSYVCLTCDFLIHKECALSPFEIPISTFHHHPLNLIYSIPQMHRYFQRCCNICRKLVQIGYWMYYCDLCTYFVHITCAKSSDTSSNVVGIQAEGVDIEPDLVEFPLPSEESLFDLIIAQCYKLQVEYQGKDDNSITVSTTANDPGLTLKHWSHEEHILVQLNLTISENDHDDDNNDKRVLICDGCTQPITVSHPSYYACIQCGYFLHAFCATKLPGELLAGISPFHPQHSLFLCQQSRFYDFVECGVCCRRTNGFYYLCKTCDIKMDLLCAFLPTKIKHRSHNHHSFILRPASDSVCRVGNHSTGNGMEYACKTCTDFEIHVRTAFYPSRMKHKYDDHPITLRDPPFFYQGVFYCEICEEQVNNQCLLYHCNECDHSFHHRCLRWIENVKIGGTIELGINNQVHTLILVIKRPGRKKSPPYVCQNCGGYTNWDYHFECDGCGFLACRACVAKTMDE